MRRITTKISTGVDQHGERHGDAVSAAEIVGAAEADDEQHHGDEQRQLMNGT
jgi:hypothetical protein